MIAYFYYALSVLVMFNAHFTQGRARQKASLPWAIILRPVGARGFDNLIHLGCVSLTLAFSGLFYDAPTGLAYVLFVSELVSLSNSRALSCHSRPRLLEGKLRRGSSLSIFSLAMMWILGYYLYKVCQ